MSWIEINGPTGNAAFFALMDSGADYLQLSESVALAVGLNLKSATHKNLQIADGSLITLPFLTGVDVVIEGNAVQVDALFVPKGNNVTPLIGRTAILHAIKFGMDDKGWLYL